MLLKDKVVIISGVGPGMGQALARIAAAEGAKVALGARNQAYLDEVAASIREAGGEAIAFSTDVTNLEQCQRLADETVKAFGRIDGLVNSAYYHGKLATLETADEEDWMKIYDVNCLGALRMSKAVIPAMKKTGGGIVNVSTMATVRPFAIEASYAAGKGGLNVLTRYLADDLGKYGIRANVCRMGWLYGASVKGYIEAEVAAGRKEEELVAEIVQTIPLNVIPPEEECAKSILFFVSDYSKMVTGASLDVNGGQYMAP